jgi:hypothetical protein
VWWCFSNKLVAAGHMYAGMSCCRRRHDHHHHVTHSSHSINAIGRHDLLLVFLGLQNLTGHTATKRTPMQEEKRQEQLSQ